MVLPLVSATAAVTPDRATFSRTTPVLPVPGLDVGGAMTTAVPTFVKEESRMETDPMLPVPSSGTSLNPTFTLVMLMDFHTHPQSQMTWTPIVQPLNVRRWAVNCWLPP